MKDEDLVQRSRDGEEEAFSQLYARYRPKVFSTAYRIMRNSEDAQDATQEIFLKLYRALPTWDPDKSSLSTWLFRLATNHAIDCWRSKKRRLDAELGWEPADAVVFQGRSSSVMHNPHQLLEAKEAVGIAAQCVFGLPNLQRRFVILRYFGGLSLDEIALFEGRSIGTVKGLLHRATRSVRHRLSQEGIG